MHSASYQKPSTREFKRLAGHLNNEPLLKDDASSAEDLCLMGVFDADGQLRSVRTRPLNAVDPREIEGIVVTVTSHTESVAELESQWERSAKALQ